MPAMVACEVEPFFTKEAKARQGKRNDLKKNIVAILQQDIPMEAKGITQAGQALNVGHAYVSQAKALKRHTQEETAHEDGRGSMNGIRSIVCAYPIRGVVGVGGVHANYRFTSPLLPDGAVVASSGPRGLY